MYTTHPFTAWKQRLSALVLAIVFTAGMLGGVDLLATQDGAPGQMAAAAAASSPRI
jgi:hypothetical protein